MSLFTVTEELLPPELYTGQLCNWSCGSFSSYGEEVLIFFRKKSLHNQII